MQSLPNISQTKPSVNDLWRLFLKERGAKINSAVAWRKFLKINLDKEGI